MTAFVPKVLHPEPDPDFVRQLRKIDPDLRVVWGYDRYMKSRWCIERKLSPERYFANYASLLEADEQRFIEQPIFDTSRPIYDENGDPTGGFEKVGSRKFDLAPEYECVLFVENEDGSYRELDGRTLLALRRVYAWERHHSISRLKAEKQAEHEERERKQKARRTEEAMQELMDHRREILNLPFSGGGTSKLD